jgi:transcriptional regulator with XRE-family HTH domain
MTPWGLAIEELLKKAGRSKRKAARQELVPYSSLSQWRRARRGPNVATLDRLLAGLGLGWQDWAAAYEQAKRTLPLHLIRNERGRGKPRSSGVRGPRTPLKVV